MLCRDICLNIHWYNRTIIIVGSLHVHYNIILNYVFQWTVLHHFRLIYNQHRIVEKYSFNGTILKRFCLYQNQSFSNNVILGISLWLLLLSCIWFGEGWSLPCLCSNDLCLPWNTVGCVFDCLCVLSNEHSNDKMYATIWPISVCVVCVVW